MNIQNLIISPDNLHRKKQTPYYPRRLFTTRDEIKGTVGDVFCIPDAGYYVLTHVIEYTSIDTLTKELYRLEGFQTPDDFRNELYRIYGLFRTRPLYAHALFKITDLYPEEEETPHADQANITIDQANEFYEVRLPLKPVGELTFRYNPKGNKNAVIITLDTSSAYLIEPTANAYLIDLAYDIIVRDWLKYDRLRQP